MVAVLRLLILANFNPRSLTGTTFWMAALALISLFQSSLPYGSDFFTPPIVQSASDFNPRSLAGATRQRLQELHCLQISIHALLRERPRLSWLHILKANFNPRSLTGAPAFWPDGRRRDIFQSTLPYGSDLSNFVSYRDLSDFNPRSLAGATSNNFILQLHKANFNPRSLAGATSTAVRFTRFSVFQSTLPRGSDLGISTAKCSSVYFNPRSLAGAT